MQSVANQQVGGSIPDWPTSSAPIDCSALFYLTPVQIFLSTNF